MSLALCCSSPALADDGGAAGGTRGSKAADAQSVGELISRGQALLKEGKGEDAVRVYQKAVELEKENAGLRQRLAKALYRVGRIEDAVKEMEMAVTIDPNRSIYHSELAWLYTQVNRLRSAVRHAKIAIKLTPDQAYPYIILGYSEGSESYFDPAIKTLSKAIELEPENPLAHRYLADIYLQDGQAEKAVTAFEKAASLEKRNATIYIGLGNAYGKLDQKEKQRDAYRQAVELAPGDPEAHGHYGWSLSNTGDLPGALREGLKANSLRLKGSWEPFMGMFISVWAGIFIVFGAIFAAIVFGARFSPQPGEDLVRSFFLAMYKDKPGRFIITSKRLVFVPELVSRSFGATRVSIQRDEVSSVTSDSGKLVINSTSGTEHVFRMPKLVLDPLLDLFKSEGIGEKAKASSKKTSTKKKAGAGSGSGSDSESKKDGAAEDKDQVVAVSLDFRPEASSDKIDAVKAEEKQEGKSEAKPQAKKQEQKEEKKADPAAEAKPEKDAGKKKGSTSKSKKSKGKGGKKS